MLQELRRGRYPDFIGNILVGLSDFNNILVELLEFNVLVGMSESSFLFGLFKLSRPISGRQDIQSTTSDDINPSLPDHRPHLYLNG